MKTKNLYIVFVALFFFILSCSDRYITGNNNEEIGINGDFEEIKNGFPVNWNIHSAPITKGHAKVILDTVDVKSGTYALKIEANKVSRSKKFWNKPGVNKEIRIDPRKKYKLSVWIKNADSEFCIKWITTNEANKNQIRSKNFIETDITFTTWYYFREIINTNENEDLLKLEIVIKEPGTIWIDKFVIEEIIDAD